MKTSSFQRLTLAALALAVSGALFSGHAAAAVVYTQAPTYPGATSASVSSSDDGGTFTPATLATTFDNFTLTSTARIGSLTWQGLSFNGDTGGTTTIPVQSFNIGFYANNAGTPGALLSSQTISFTQTFVAAVDLNGVGRNNLYNYTGNLSSAFSALGGTSYFLSIQGNTPYPAEWAWTSGTGGNGTSYQTYINDAGATVVSPTVSGDRAFTLNSVPDTGSTLILLGLGVVSIMAAHRQIALRI